MSDVRSVLPSVTRADHGETQLGRGEAAQTLINIVESGHWAPRLH
jgi:hypothetical protein